MFRFPYRVSARTIPERQVARSPRSHSRPRKPCPFVPFRKICPSFLAWPSHFRECASSKHNKRNFRTHRFVLSRPLPPLIVPESMPRTSKPLSTLVIQMVVMNGDPVSFAAEMSGYLLCLTLYKAPRVFSIFVARHSVQPSH